MLKIDYHFSRNQGNKIEKFSPPDEIKEIPSTIAILEAPNASGKSTLLNILAIGLNGHRIDPKKCNISDSIRERIKDLLDSPNHELTFDFSIKNGNDSLEIVSGKKDPSIKDIITYEISGGKKTNLTDVNFPDKYFFIYDIPENPLKRLPYLIQQIKSQQASLGYQVGDLTGQVHTLLQEIREAKNPEKIEALKEKIRGLNEENSRINTEISGTEYIKAELAKYQAHKFYRHYVNSLERLGDQLIGLESKIKNYGKNKKSKNSQYSNQLKIVVQSVDIIRENHKKLSDYFPAIFSENRSPEIKTALKNWAFFKPDQILETLFLNENYPRLTEYFIKEIQLLNQDPKLKKAAEARKFYSELLRILRNYEKSDFLFPGQNKSLAQIIADLENECKNYSHLATVMDNFSQSLELLREMSKVFQQLPPILQKTLSLKGKVKIIDEAEQDTLEDLENLFTKREKEYNVTIAAITKYKDVIGDEFALDQLSYEDLGEIVSDFQKTHPDLSKYFSLTEDQITRELMKISGAIHEMRDHIVRNNKIVEKETSELKRLESRPEHKYQEKYQVLEEIHEHCQNLERIIRQSLKNHLENLGNRVQAKNSNEQMVYDLVFRYLSKRIPVIPYNDEMITTQKIDLINKTIIDESGKRTINFSDISTGQGISIYLRSLLKLPKEDKRKIIAFFDEIATMDSKTLGYLIDDLIQLDKNNRLLCAILVQKSDKLQLRTINGPDVNVRS